MKKEVIKASEIVGLLKQGYTIPEIAYCVSFEEEKLRFRKMIE